MSSNVPASRGVQVVYSRAHEIPQYQYVVAYINYMLLQFLLLWGVFLLSRLYKYLRGTRRATLYSKKRKWRKKIEL